MSTASAQSSVRAALAQTNELFCNEMIAKRNFSALDDVYTTDARILPPGAPMIQGREAIKRFWADLVAATSATGATLETIDLIEAGDGLVEIGRAVLTTPGGQLEAKYVVYWRQEDGRWKLHVDTWNFNA